GGGTWTLGGGSSKITGPGSVTFSAIPIGATTGVNNDTIALNYTAGNNDYQGATTLNTVLTFQFARIQWSQNEQIPDNSAVTLTGNPGTNGSSGVDFNGKTETIGSLAGSNTLSIIRNLGAFTTGQNNLSTSYVGTISGAGSFTKVGTGVQTLGGATSY